MTGRFALTHSAPDGAVSNGRAIWSPDGKWIAFVQSDESDVRLRPMLVPDDPSYPEVREVRFARVGGTIPTLRVGVVDAQGKETRWLPIPMPAEGFYLGQVEWAGNSHELLIEKLSRFRNEREFLLADIRTGALRRIFHETDPAWVDRQLRHECRVDVDSRRPGIHRPDRKGRLAARLRLFARRQGTGSPDARCSSTSSSAPWWMRQEAGSTSTRHRTTRPRSTSTVSAWMEPAAPERVTPTNQPGTHDYDFSPDAKWAFHTYSTFDNPPVTELVQLSDHQVVRVLEEQRRAAPEDEAIDLAAHRVLPARYRRRRGRGRVDDQTSRTSIPPRNTPCFVYVYGEPHAQTVLDAWGKVHADYHRVIADLGYLVVSIDNRGTPAPKGAAWRRAIFGSLGPLSTEEQAAALKELARTRPYVDASRVAIWGWSGGGSNTLNAMFRKPDVYHVGIAVAPKPQPHLYNAWFQEIYMQTPETNPDGYRRAAPINFAEGLKGRPVDRSRHGREQHPSSDYRRTGGPPHRTGQAVRLHGLSQS